MTDISVYTVTGIKPKIVKGQENRNFDANVDANSMAKL